MGGRQPRARAMCRSAVGYLATRSDGERHVFRDLFEAKRFCQMGGLSGTVRILEAGDVPAAVSSETHWCVGCDRDREAHDHDCVVSELRAEARRRSVS